MPSLAEKLRAHREAFVLAQQLRCTPKEAEAEIARRAARAQWQESSRRLAARQSQLRAPAAVSAPVEPEDRPQPWWNRD